MQIINNSLQIAIKELNFDDCKFELSRPNQRFGDWSTNVAMQVAKKNRQEPREVANIIVENIKSKNYDWLSKIEIAGPGFINFYLKDEFFVKTVNYINQQQHSYGKQSTYDGQTILVEYLDPNPFKEIHIGHVYTGTVGDAIATLFEAAGGQVHRVTYQGDVGMHVAKAIYGILRRIDNDPTKLNDIPETERPKFLGETYADGAAAYENNNQAKNKIVELNKIIYERSDAVVNQIHETGVSWSMKYFDEVYIAYGFTPFEKNYLESKVSKEGLKIVKEHIGDGVFDESDGAVIFRGEPYGLHTRVFINSQGLPTYDAKDLGNAMLKWRDYKYNKSIIITAEEQTEYFRVMLKALVQFAPEQANNTTHIPHGMVKLSSGKMSSRSGDVVKALDLLKAAEETTKKLAKDNSRPVRDITLAGIKYAFLKNRIGGDIVYDVEESLNLEGNSGPYIQYAHARACSIIAKSNEKVAEVVDLDQAERLIASKLDEFPEVILQAAKQLHPHLVCTYLFELAQSFNQFYEHNRIIGDPRQTQRLALINAYKTVLSNGLGVLRIIAPNQM